MKRVLGFSLVTALILAGVHVIANPSIPAKIATKATAKAAAKGKAKRLPTCPTCVVSVTYPPNEALDGREVPGVTHTYTRCVDFDNVPPGHCCAVLGKTWTVVSRTKPYNTVGMYIIFNCKGATPGPVACGSPSDPPYMANPHPLTPDHYWQNYSPGGNSAFSLPYFRKSIAKASGNAQCNKCSAPDTH